MSTIELKIFNTEQDAKAKSRHQFDGRHIRALNSLLIDNRLEMTNILYQQAGF